MEFNCKKLNDRPYWYIKRLFDIIISLVLLIVTLPLLVITVIITICDLGFPIYNEKRLREGLYKKPFVMYKIRTKKLHSDNLIHRKRYTKLSKLIDWSHLNEIPQLINILKGDMSFIGPRPFIPGDKLPDVKINDERYMVRPGLTGLAQARGGRFLGHKLKLALDVEYYENFGFLQDAKIILLTPIDLIRQSNGYYLKKWFSKK